jgi:hypothetical protein
VRLRKDRETVRNESGRTVAERPALTISTADQLPQDAPHLHEGMPMTFADLGFVARRALPYAAGLVALTVAAGCTSGSPTPSASTAVPPMATSSTVASVPPSTSAAPKPSVDPVVAKIPAAARPETMRGAEHYATFYFEQLNRSFKTGSPDLLDGLYSDSCAVCVDLYKSAEELQAKGLRHDGDTLTVTFSSATVFSPKTRQVLVKLDQHAVPVINATGQQTAKTEAGLGAFVVVLQYKNRWIVTDLGRPS